MDLTLLTVGDRIENNVNNFNSGFEAYLGNLGLPCKEILIDPEERLVVVDNLPSALKRLTEEQKLDAMYISKFVAACGAGLFDAALNFLMNETILNLRKKVMRYDLKFFLESLSGLDEKKKKSINTEEDLKKLEEWEFIRGCKETGIITELGYKHLDYIRDMRNHASAAHPNQNSIDGLQLVSWLQTCIKEVLSVEPKGPVIEIRCLINNIREHELKEEDAIQINTFIGELREELATSLLNAIFGMYSTPTTDIKLRNNIMLIANSVWERASDKGKTEIAIKYMTFSINAQIAKKELAYSFLEQVDGLSYLSDDCKSLELDVLLDDLYYIHYGYNNFYKEPPIARKISKYVNEDGKIPDIVRYKYVKNIMLCYLGNYWGISEGAYEYYERAIGLFTELEIEEFIKILKDTDIQNTLEGRRAQKYIELANKFYNRVTNENLKQLLEKIKEVHPGNLKKIYMLAEFDYVFKNGNDKKQFL